LGFKRILTSGQKPTVSEGINLIRQLVQQAGNKIIIMPGSGVRSNIIEELKNVTQAKEFHSSALKKISSSMQYINSFMNEKNEYAVVDEDEIKKMKTLLKNLPAS
jgi:copper homeostasis protein